MNDLISAAQGAAHHIASVFSAKDEMVSAAASSFANFDMDNSLSTSWSSSSSSGDGGNREIECGSFNVLIRGYIYATVIMLCIYLVLYWLNYHVPWTPHSTTIALPYTVLRAAVNSALWNVVPVLLVFFTFHNLAPNMIVGSDQASCVLLTLFPANTVIIMLQALLVVCMYNSNRVVHSIGHLVNPTVVDVLHRSSMFRGKESKPQADADDAADATPDNARKQSKRRKNGGGEKQYLLAGINGSNSSPAYSGAGEGRTQSLMSAPSDGGTADDVLSASPSGDDLGAPLLSSSAGDGEGSNNTPRGKRQRGGSRRSKRRSQYFQRTLYLGVFAHGALLIDAIQQQQAGVLLTDEFFAVDLSVDAVLRPIILHNIQAVCRVSEQEANKILISTTVTKHLRFHLPFADGFFNRVVIAPYVRFNRPINNLITTEPFKQKRMAALLREALRVLAPGGSVDAYDTLEVAEFLKADLRDAGVIDYSVTDTGCPLSLLPCCLSSKCYVVTGVKSPYGETPKTHDELEKERLKDLADLYDMPLSELTHSTALQDDDEGGDESGTATGSSDQLYDDVVPRTSVNARKTKPPLSPTRNDSVLGISSPVSLDSLYGDFNDTNGAPASGAGGGASAGVSDRYRPRGKSLMEVVTDPGYVRQSKRYLIVVCVQLVIGFSLAFMAMLLYRFLNFPTMVPVSCRVYMIFLSTALQYPTVAVVHREVFWHSTELYPSVARLLRRILPVEALIVAWCFTISVIIITPTMVLNIISVKSKANLPFYLISILGALIIIPTIISIFKIAGYLGLKKAKRMRGLLKEQAEEEEERFRDGRE